MPARTAPLTPLHAVKLRIHARGGGGLLLEALQIIDGACQSGLQPVLRGDHRLGAHDSGHVESLREKGEAGEQLRDSEALGLTQADAATDEGAEACRNALRAF